MIWANPLAAGLRCATERLIGPISSWSWKFGTAICSDPHFQHISKQQMLAPHPLIRVLAATSSCGQVQGYCNIDAHDTNCLLPHFIRLLVQLHQFRLSTENQLNQPLCGITRASHPLRLHLQVAVHGEIEGISELSIDPKSCPKPHRGYPDWFQSIPIIFSYYIFHISIWVPKLPSEATSQSSRTLFSKLAWRVASRSHGDLSAMEQLGTTQDFRPFWTSKMGNIS